MINQIGWKKKKIQKIWRCTPRWQKKKKPGNEK